uniref:Cerebral cavernous malformations 2 harmonin-homology domain-containing protein n=1 Tax=Meloidogyne incognita TaxID=6306 RepID=A0A914LMH5_MELIC
MGEPLKLDWPVLFGKLVEAVTDVGADEEINFLRLTESEGNSDDWTDHLFCDCIAMTIIDKVGEAIAVVPLHQVASVGLLPSKNILSVRIGDVNLSKDLFDLLIIYVPNEVIAKEICQHFVDCFQFIYREAISEFEKEEEDEENDLLVEQQNLDLETKFLPSTLISTSSTSASLCSSPISSIFQQQFKTTTNCLKIEEENLNKNYLITNSTTTNSSLSSSSNLSTINICGSGSYVELINEYLTDLSTSLSHDELNKFAILMRRWRSREMPIVEFAQKLLELYGPERRHLLAKMRTLLRGDPTEIEALGNFLCANGVVENNASAAVSQATKINRTTKIIFREEKNISKSCPQSSTTITNSL